MSDKVDRWFGPVASAIVVAATACLSLYIWQHVQLRLFPGWPYPAFTLLVAAIFTAYDFLVREKSR